MFYRFALAYVDAKVKHIATRQMCIEGEDGYNWNGYINTFRNIVGAAYRGDLDMVIDCIDKRGEEVFISSVLNEKHAYVNMVYYGNFSSPVDGLIAIRSDGVVIAVEKYEVSQEGYLIHWACIGGWVDVVKYLYERFGNVLELNPCIDVEYDGRFVEIDSLEICRRNGHVPLYNYIKERING